MTHFRAGRALPPATTPAERLLDLLPQPLNHARLSQRIEEMSAAAIREDFEARTLSTEPEENDGDEIMVSLDDWIDADDQLWGEERYAIGPI